MCRNSYLIINLFAISLLSFCAQLSFSQTRNESIQYLQYCIEYLANDSLQGRLPGTKGEAEAGLFIMSEMKQIGLKALKKKEYQQVFSYAIDSNTIKSFGNIIGSINVGAKKSIVLGAHYDHLGMGERHSREPFKHGIHNGADDNASGIALLLLLAKYAIKIKPSLRYNIVFVAFSGEEDGLWGSSYFVKQNSVDTNSILCYLNFDMVGHLNNLTPIITIEGSKEFSFFDSLKAPILHPDFSIRLPEEISIGGSDHYSFVSHHIPALSFTTGITDDYHKTTDDADKINYEGIMFLSEYVEQLLHAINKKTTPQLQERDFFHQYKK